MTGISKKKAKEIELLIERIKGFDPAFEDKELLKGVEEKFGEFERLVAEIDRLRAQITQLVDKKNDLAKQVLADVRRLKDAVGVQYGLDSPQYEAVGRKRSSEHKRPGFRSTNE